MTRNPASASLLRISLRRFDPIFAGLASQSGHMVNSIESKPVLAIIVIAASVLRVFAP